MTSGGLIPSVPPWQLEEGTIEVGWSGQGDPAEADLLVDSEDDEPLDLDDEPLEPETEPETWDVADESEIAPATPPVDLSPRAVVDHYAGISGLVRVVAQPGAAARAGAGGG